MTGRSRSAELGRLQQASFGHTLLAVARLFDLLGQERLNAKLGADVARPSVMRLVPHMDRRGVRPSELARLTDVTKQAVGQTLRELEERGLVEYAPDPSDGRAVLVRMTAAGEAAARLGLEALSEVERELAEAVGGDVVTSTFAGLQAIMAALEARAAPHRVDG